KLILEQQFNNKTYRLVHIDICGDSKVIVSLIWQPSRRFSKTVEATRSIICLQVLSMGGNLLTEVPSTLGQLKSLQALVLCDNQIEKIPTEIAKLQYLKSLLLHKNRLKTLPQEICTLKNLSELSLRDNPLVVRFVTTMTHNPASLLELAARIVKIHNIYVKPGDIPNTLTSYLDCAHRCVNPNCKG
ncbi:hypothetical protein AMK59_6264, partial [Oryctes borbonicus]